MTTRTKNKDSEADASTPEMSLGLLQGNLKPVVERANRIADTKSVYEVTQNLLLTAADGRLSVAATNLEQTVIGHVGAVVYQEGSALVNARVFTSLVNNLPDNERVELTMKGSALHVTSGRVKAQLHTTHVANMPPLPSLADAPAANAVEFTVPVEAFLPVLRRVMLAAANDASRPVLCGVYFDMGSDGLLKLAAADGFRLAVDSLQTEYRYNDAGPLNTPHGWLIPAKSLREPPSSYELTAARRANPWPTEPAAAAYSGDLNAWMKAAKPNLEGKMVIG